MSVDFMPSDALYRAPVLSFDGLTDLTRTEFIKCFSCVSE
jgi:hypothetical protein